MGTTITRSESKQGAQCLCYGHGYIQEPRTISSKYHNFKGQTFQDIIKFPTDTERLKEIRAAAIEWGLAQDEREASVFTEAGTSLPSSWSPRTSA